MQRPKRRHQPFSNRTEHLMFRLGVFFIIGLLLVVATIKLGLPAMAQSTLIAPVFSPPTAEMRALEKRPIPLDSSVSVPDEVKVCMASSGERFDVLGTTQDQGKTYYLLGIYPDFVSRNPLDADDELIETDATTGCTRLVSLDSVKQPLSVYMSEAAAQDLELQRYQHYITQLGGVSQFQKALTEQIDADHGLYLLSDEQVHALEQLHVQFSKNYRKLTAETFS